MIKRIGSLGLAIVAMSAGTLVLLGYFIEALGGFRTLLFETAVILAGVAGLVGIGNLFSVHFGKIRARSKNYPYSFLLLLSMLFVIGLGLLAMLNVPGTREMVFSAVNAVVVPVELSLMAVLAVTLAYASVRLLRWRTDFKSILFFVTVLIVLVGSAVWPLIGPLPVVSDMIRPLITQVLAAGGARGLLIGIALGTLTTGLRVLLGADRPYGGK